MIFEFSRLDMNLGLTVVWLNGGNDIPGRTKTATGMPFNSRLRTIGDAVAKTHPIGSKRRKAWDDWIERAHAARLKRNDLIHGRWGVEPQRQVVTNVIGLPTGEQRETAYRIEDLEGFVAELRKLHGDLWPLREKWPV